MHAAPRAGPHLHAQLQAQLRVGLRQLSLEVLQAEDGEKKVEGGASVGRVNDRTGLCRHTAAGTRSTGTASRALTAMASLLVFMSVNMLSSLLVNCVRQGGRSFVGGITATRPAHALLRHGVHPNESLTARQAICLRRARPL